jgi:DNA-binding beta-propeller fold protein YncE
LFGADESSGNVYKVRLSKAGLPSDADVSTMESVPAAHGVAFDPASGSAYVSRSEADTVDVFDPASMRLTKRIAVANDPDAIFYDRFHNLIYVASGDAKSATLIDPRTQESVLTIPLGGKPEFAVFDSKTKWLYQNLEDTDSIVALDLAKRSIVQRWGVGACRGPSGLALDEEGRRLFVVCSRNAMLAIVDMDARRVVRTIPIGGGPDSVAFDSQLHRIYTTGKSGTLVVVQQETPDAYRVIDSLSLHYGAHTLTMDPATHAVYVGYASLLVRPRVAMFTASR